MTITGLVHTNSHAYVSQPSPGTLTFGDATTPTYLSYVGGYTDSTWVDSGWRNARCTSRSLELVGLYSQ